MLANDRYGDCVVAGAGHETILWNKEGGRNVVFTDAATLSDYSAITGFNPNDPSTDNGTDMQVAASYRKNTGLIDASGTRHKVAAYLALSHDNIKVAVYLFGAVGIGVQFPEAAMAQFKAGKPFTSTRSAIAGGHYMPLIGGDSKYAYFVTWGKVQPATWGWVKKYMDEGVAYLSEEFLTGDKSLEGFDLAQLQKDLAALAIHTTPVANDNGAVELAA